MILRQVLLIAALGLLAGGVLAQDGKNTAEAKDDSNKTTAQIEDTKPKDIQQQKNTTTTEELKPNNTTETSSQENTKKNDNNNDKSTDAKNVTQSQDHNNSTESNPPKKVENDESTNSENVTQSQDQINSSESIDSKIDSEQNNKKNFTENVQSQGYDSYYDDFSFDQLFADDYDYFGYDKFGEEYFKMDFDDDEEDNYYYNFMYQDLYGDSYQYDYQYEDSTAYADYEYYGNYGYYGVYDDQGYLYGYGSDNTYNENEVEEEYEYMIDYFQFQEDACREDENGQIIFDASMDVCNVSVSGADDLVKNMDGGLDGTYELAGCANGRPKYVRYEPKGQERIMWWSSVYGDWDITTGDEPNNKDILVYGGDSLNEERPNFVLSWHIAVDILSQSLSGAMQEEDYIPIDLKVTCTNGTQIVRPERAQMGNQPLLTDKEMDNQYRMIYEKYGKIQSTAPQINFTLVVMMVFVGMGVVLGIPYMMVKRNQKGKSMQLSNVDQRKKRVGKY